MLHFTFYISTGNIESRIFGSRRNHLIKDFERFLELPFFLFQGSQTQPPAIILRIKLQQAIIIDSCRRIIPPEHIDICPHQQRFFILLVFVKYQAIIGIGTIRISHFQIDRSPIQQDRHCQWSKVQCKGIRFECLIIFPHTALYQPQIGEKHGILRILRFQFQSLKQKLFRFVETVHLDIFNRLF